MKAKKFSIYLLLGCWSWLCMATTCPDMSNTSKIPMGWYSLWYMEYSAPGRHNTFAGASFLMTITSSYQPVSCTYVPEGNSMFNGFTLQSRATFPLPTEGGWYSRHFSNLQICDGPTIEHCSF